MADVAVVEGRAGRLDITIERYSSLALPLHFKEKVSGLDVDLSVYDSGFKMQVREGYKSEDAMLELSTANTKIENTDLPGGDITLIFLASDTAALDKPGLYDLVGMKSSGDVERLLEGVIRWKDGITR